MIQKKSITIRGHSTSICLEPDFWDLLKKVAHDRNVSLAELVAQIDSEMPSSQKRNLSSTIRCYLLRHVLSLVKESTKG